MEPKPLNTVADILNAFQECKGIAEEEFELFDRIAALNDPPIQGLIEIVQEIQLQPLLALALQVFSNFSNPEVQAKISKNVELLEVLSHYAQTNSSELIQWSAIKAVIGIDYGFETIVKHFAEYPQKIEDNLRRLFLEKNDRGVLDYYSKIYGPDSRERIKRLKETRKRQDSIHINDGNDSRLVENDKIYVSVEVDSSFGIDLSPTGGVILSPDGKHIIYHRFNTISVWDVAKREIVHELRAFEEGDFKSLDISADGKILVCIESFWSNNNVYALVWNLHAGRITEKIPLRYVPNFYEDIEYQERILINSIKICPDGEFFAAMCRGENTNEGKIVMYSLSSLTAENDFISPSQHLIAFSPANSSFITADSEGIINLFSSYLHGEREKECITLCSSPPEDGAKYIEFSPNGDFMVINYKNGSLDVWNAETWEKAYELTERTERVDLFAFSPCSRVIATGTQDGLVYARFRLWRLRDGELIHDLREPIGDISSMTFSSDGKTLIAVSTSGVVQTWKLN